MEKEKVVAIIGIGEQCMRQTEKVEARLAGIRANGGHPLGQLLCLAEEAQMAIVHFSDLAGEALRTWQHLGGKVSVEARELILRLGHEPPRRGVNHG